MMYAQIKEEIKENFYQQNFPNDGQRFVAWYLRNVHLRDPNECKDDMIDGAGDKQIDAIVIDDEKQTIFVVQGKFISESSVDAEPLREVLSSWMQFRDLVRLQEVGNQKLKRKLSEVALALDDDYEIAFELVTTGVLTNAANEDLATFQQTLVELSENEDFNASLTIIDKDEIQRRYEIALMIDNPVINHTIDITDGQSMKVDIAGTNVVVASIPLKECVKLPGIKNGTLFQKNVRQSLGLSNRVNKGIKHTIYSDNHKDFFFFHNGITAICNKLTLENSHLKLHGLSVVNGCQSLNTIFSCSERVKKLEDTFILFRFYEIPQRERGDKISINTNSQSAVKPRDLRSNDKRVLAIKRTFEQRYPTGLFTTKRGEDISRVMDKTYLLDLANLGKYLITWQSQRPNIAYSETKIFDKYFDQLFKKNYSPEKAQALNFWMQEIMTRWTSTNPLGLNESLLAMKAYAPFHHLYAVSVCFGVSNAMPMESVPNVATAYNNANQNNLVAQIVDLAGKSLNFALESAANEPQEANRVFSAQNWIKAKKCLAGIRAAVSQSLSMIPMMNTELAAKLKQGLKMDNEGFEARWTAD